MRSHFFFDLFQFYRFLFHLTRVVSFSCLLVSSGFHLLITSSLGPLILLFPSLPPSFPLLPTFPYLSPLLTHFISSSPHFIFFSLHPLLFSLPSSCLSSFLTFPLLLFLSFLSSRGFFFFSLLSLHLSSHSSSSIINPPSPLVSSVLAMLQGRTEGEHPVPAQWR